MATALRPARRSASSGSKHGRWRLCPSRRRSGANGAKNSTATETTATAEAPEADCYVGRFAPSPTGALHLGSLYAAAASYLDARANRGRWLLRLEDLDRPRVVAGSAALILRTLEGFGFEWDGEAVTQSLRTERYAAALDSLAARGLTFPCSCSRAQLIDDERYPGHCRSGPLDSTAPTALRLWVDPGHIQFHDRIQGTFRQDVAAAVGDIVLKRRDQIYAYLLAVVVDDDAQGVTHVLRGADLLDNTPRQIYLQRRLNLRTPQYAHVPVLTEKDGSKLAKSARSVAVDRARVVPVLIGLFELLGLVPPAELALASVPEVWAWAITRFRIEGVPKRLTHALRT